MTEYNGKKWEEETLKGGDDMAEERKEDQPAQVVTWKTGAPNFKQMYIQCFNAMTDAIEALENHRVPLAIGILKTAQRRTEEAYMQEEPQKMVFYIHGSESDAKP